MAKTLHCWRCKTDIPMLEEHEWEQVMPALSDAIRQMQQYRLDHNLTLAEAKSRVYGQDALGLYFQITGMRETNANALWHHRLSQFGPPCSACGKPLRTPHAKLCAECGTPAQA